MPAEARSATEDTTPPSRWQENVLENSIVFIPFPLRSPCHHYRFDLRAEN